MKKGFNYPGKSRLLILNITIAVTLITDPPPSPITYAGFAGWLYC